MRAREAKDLADILFKLATTDRTLMQGIEVFHEIIDSIIKDSTPLLMLVSELYPDPEKEPAIPTPEKMKLLMDACVTTLLAVRKAAMKTGPMNFATKKLNDLRNKTKLDLLEVIKKGVSKEVFIDIEKRMAQKIKQKSEVTSMLELAAKALVGKPEDEEDIFDENSEKCKLCERFEICKMEQTEQNVTKMKDSDDPTSDDPLTFKLGEVFESPKEGKV